MNFFYVLIDFLLNNNLQWYSTDHYKKNIIFTNPNPDKHREMPGTIEILCFIILHKNSEVENISEIRKALWRKQQCEQFIN